MKYCRISYKNKEAAVGKSGNIYAIKNNKVTNKVIGCNKSLYNRREAREIDHIYGRNYCSKGPYPKERSRPFRAVHSWAQG